MCGCHKTFLNAGVDVDIVLTLFQTLTGKEIEIDIEPTDKVKYDSCWKFKRTTHWHSLSLSWWLSLSFFFFLSKMKVERIKERVEEKEGIPPQQQRLIYSGKQMWVSPSSDEFSTAAERFLHFSTSFSTLLPCFVPQEWWEDSCRLQDPRRLGAPPCVGAKRRLLAPPALRTLLLLVMSRCHDGATWVPLL